MTRQCLPELKPGKRFPIIGVLGSHCASVHVVILRGSSHESLKIGLILPHSRCARVL